MAGKIVLNLDKVRQGVAVSEGELLHKVQMDLLLDKIRQIMASVADFRQQFESGQRQSSISHRRHHDAILLSGARGTGKTTFLLAALHKLQREKLDDKYSFCVFEPVDPTLFGYNEHILFTLLSMIVKEVCRCRDFYDTTHYCHTGDSRDWESWEKQLKELAKGLQTVGEQREDIGSGPSPKKDVWDDAEYLLEEGMDKARSSYELEFRLHSFINTSLKLLHKDAFVLGLDDVDTRPGIGWHVLEVLRRYLTTPQIIVIVSGNMELFQKLVERQQLKNFGLDFSSNSRIRNTFTLQVTELTNQYLLKVLRTPLRIDLLPFYEALERAIVAETTIDANITDIDSNCRIELYGKQASLADILKIFYSALNCNTSPNLKAIFRKALLANSARTVLQLAEQLIELQDSLQARDSMMLSRRVADILRVAFFDYLVASGLPQPQEYFERLRGGAGIEEISRLLLEGKLPSDLSLRPVHGELRINNSLLALTSGLTAAVAGNIGIFFVYFFKVCLALQVLDGQQPGVSNAILGETSLIPLAFRCSSLLYGDARRPGWRAPGILAVYGASIKKNIPDRVKKIYGEDSVELFKKYTPKQLLENKEEILPFIETMCCDTLLTQQRGNVILNGYVITTYDSLQDHIKSWHQALVPHGFYEIAEQGGNYPFFSIWGLLGLMVEILTYATEEDIFNIFFRNTRTMRFTYYGNERTFYSRRMFFNDADNDNSEDSDNSSESENDSISRDMIDDAKSAENLSAENLRKQKLFIQWLMEWKKMYAEQSSICFSPSVLCERIFIRFQYGMERLNSFNSSDIFLGSYIHKALVIFFNVLLIEEYIAYHGKVDGLNLTTPLSSDNIFIQNFRKVAEVEQLDTDLDPALLPSALYPLTRLVMACPLWSFYVKPDEQDVKSIFRMLKCFWPNYTDKNDQIIYIDEQHCFDNLYYIYNALAIRRRLVFDFDLRTELGKKMDVMKNPKKLISKTLLEALELAIEKNELKREELEEMDDGTEDFGKKAFHLLYTVCPSTERLWASARDTRQRFLKGLRSIKPRSAKA